VDDLMFFVLVLFCGCSLITVLNIWLKKQAKIQPETKKPKQIMQYQHPNDRQQDMDRLFNADEWGEFGDEEMQSWQRQEEISGW